MCNVQCITVHEFATNQKILSVYDFILTLKVTEIFFCTFVATATIVHINSALQISNLFPHIYHY